MKLQCQSRASKLYKSFHFHHHKLVIMLTAKGVKNSCFLVASLLLLLLVSPSHASSDNLNQASFAASAGTQKVDLALYYESLCPACEDFIVNELVNVFNKGLSSIVNLKLVPWGNVQVSQNGTITCQHGPEECRLNTIEACVIKIWPDVNKHFKYIHCMEGLFIENGNKDLRTCFATTADWNSVENCYRSGLGSQLEQHYRDETDRLNPPHEYVPWVVVNNIPLKEDCENYIQYVCKAYKGPLPDACKSPKLKVDSAEKANTAKQVSYAGDVKTSTYLTPVKGTSQQKILGRPMKIRT